MSLNSPLTLRLLVCMWLLAVFSNATARANIVVHLDSGIVQGFMANQVVEFRGIPFAQPPIGNLRFEPPVPANAWTGVLKTLHWRSACPQAARFNQTDESLDEDCLYLNVALTPSNKQRRPVLVWFYGGAYVGGSANLYQLQWLAKATNAIVVAGNYRVGAFGFLSHPSHDSHIGSSVGLLDQRLLLDWVHKNISALGGDPANITIAGESAGAISVCLHLSSPQNNTQSFAKAIVQSGACLTPLARETELYQYGLLLAEQVGCDAKDFNCLKSVPVAKLLAAQNSITSVNPRAFVPAIGSDFVPEAPKERLARGDFVRVPILQGANRDEMALYIGYQVAYGDAITVANLADATQSVYGDKSSLILTEYSTDPSYVALAAPAKLGRLESDFVQPGTLSHCLVLKTADTFSKWTTLYEYEFTDRDGPPQMSPEPFKLGAVHASELPYLFEHISHNHYLDGADLNLKSRWLSKQMLRLWGAFITNGNPSTTIQWPRYLLHGPVLELNPLHIGPMDSYAQHHCSFWAHLYPDIVQ